MLWRGYPFAAQVTPARIHLTLKERAPVVDLGALLSIGMVKRISEKGGAIIIKKRHAGGVTLGDLAAPRVALLSESFDRSLP